MISSLLDRLLVVSMHISKDQVQKLQILYSVSRKEKGENGGELAEQIGSKTVDANKLTQCPMISFLKQTAGAFLHNMECDNHDKSTSLTHFQNEGLFALRFLCLLCHR